MIVPANSYLQEVYSQTADEGYFDFARCQRADGTIYGSPGKCKKGKEIGAKEEAPAQKLSADRKMQLTAKIKAMSAADLKKVAKDPRLSERQRGKLQELIAAKEAQEKKVTTPAAKVARPVSQKGTDKMAAALAAKAAGSGYTPEQLAAQDALLAKMQKREEARRGHKELREEVMKDQADLEFITTYQKSSEENLSTLRRSYATMQQLMTPGSHFNTPANRARMINTRLAIWKHERALANRGVAQKIDPATYAKTVKESPKYDKTPGSSKAIPRPKPEDADKLQANLNRLSKELDKKGISNERALEISSEILETNRRLMAARGDSRPSAPSLKDIYKEQNFNAKPELVGTASDLRSRKDLLTNPDGTNVIMYRGVTIKEFSDQFKGLGENGDQHFAGRGIFGNGSYAAAAAAHDTRGTAAEAQKTARAYAGEKKDIAAKVTAFGLRKDANVVTFTGADRNERTAQYDQWVDDVRDRAEKATGYRFNDVGEAAAALGIHAYQVPQRGEDFFVILNRGAVVAAMDSQLSDEN
jgi:hypothetical protein